MSPLLRSAGDRDDFNEARKESRSLRETGDPDWRKERSVSCLGIAAVTGLLTPSAPVTPGLVASFPALLGVIPFS
jgi:hypothetical protein